MERLDVLHRRIATVHSLQSIVRTMKTLSAVSIRHYEQAAASLAEYERTVHMGLQAVLRDRQQPLRAAPRRRPRGLGAIVFGSDHGLCGRFNEAVVDFALGRLDPLTGDGRTSRLLAVGERAAGLLE